jgi:hypothetical protein
MFKDFLGIIWYGSLALGKVMIYLLSLAALFVFLGLLVILVGG